MNQLVGTLILTLLGFTSFAQQLLNTEGRLMEYAPYFNASFIRENNIRFIQSKVSYKDDMQPIRRTARKQKYKFDRLGRLVRYAENYFINGRYDSSYTEFTYSKEGLLLREKVKDAYGMHMYTYKYNPEGDLIEKIHTRPSNRNIPPKIEQFKYEYYGSTQKKKLFLNDENRVFKEENINKNSLGKLDEVNSSFRIARKREHKDFMYDKNGFLQKMVHVSQNSPIVTVQFDYVNDEKGNPLEESITRNGKLLTKKEFLFKDGLIDAILKRDENTNRITITELEYKFF